MANFGMIQDINPLTGDVGLNPAAWGLSMRDINSAASISLKSSIYSGNVNLTADQYREMNNLIENKYSSIDASGLIAPGGITKDGNLAPAIIMTGKDSGLYMSNDHLGFFDGTNWQAYIQNNGNFFFGGDPSNYILWNGSELTIRGTLLLEDGSPAGEGLVTFSQSATPTALNIGDLWYNTTTTITTRWDGSAWVSMRDVGATRAASALDVYSRYTKWLDSNDISETLNKVSTSYTGVVLDYEGIGGYTAGVPTFKINRATGAAFYSGSITAAGLDVGTAGNVRGGQTAYNTGTGFFLGYSGAAHKFSIGNVTNSLTWNGTALSLTGALTSTATITGGTLQTASSGARAVIGSGGSIELFNATVKRIDIRNEQISMYDPGGALAGYFYGDSAGMIGLNSDLSVGGDVYSFYLNSSTSIYAGSTITANTDIISGNDIYALRHIYVTNTAFLNGKLKIPVGTNLY